MFILQDAGIETSEDAKPVKVTGFDKRFKQDN